MPPVNTYCRIEMLGELRVVLRDKVIRRFRTQKTALLLAYLAHHSGQAATREFLIEMLWPASDTGRAGLSTCLASLRRQLEPPGVQAGSVLQADRQTVRLNPEAFTTDVTEFELLLTQAAVPQTPPEQRLRLLQQAVELARGEFLTGHYDDWVTGEQAHRAERLIETRLALAALLAEQGDLPAALVSARQAQQADPYRESASRLVMLVQTHMGQVTGALETYALLEKRLQQDLSAAPNRATRSLAEQLRTDPESLRRVPVQEGFPLAPRPSTAAVPPLLPAAHGAAAASPTVSLLPLQTTRFFGRKREIEQIRKLLQPHAASEPSAAPRRLLTLTGPGGVGKTRLAIEAARLSAPAFSGGVWFASLADVPHPRLLPFALAHALQLPVVPSADALQPIVEKLSQGPTLLLLDNFEHLLHDQTTSKIEDFKAADASVVVRLLLERAPELSLLVTSRRVLGLGGEQELGVAALSVPPEGADIDRLLEYGSVALYADRASYVLPDFAVTARNGAAVAELCRQLEGMPLAIEMAAAWVKTLSPAQMATKLASRLDLLVSRRRDLPARQRSLRATMEWSYDLLSPEQQAFFGQLSVFRGGWELEAAEAVCLVDTGETPCPTTSVLDLLAQLQEHSVIALEEREDEARYRFLETIREFAAEKLAEAGKTDLIRDRHAAYYDALIRRAETALRGPEQAAWLHRLERDLGNLRSLLDGLAKRPEHAQESLSLCIAMTEFWKVRGYVGEGRHYLKAALALVGPPADWETRAKALHASANLAQAQGDLREAVAAYEECLHLRRGRDDKPGAAATLLSLGQAARKTGDWEKGGKHLEEAAVLFGTLGNRRGAAISQAALAELEGFRQNFGRAMTLYEQSVAVFRELGDRRFLAMCLGSQAYIVREQHDEAAAIALEEEAIVVLREIGDRGNLCVMLLGIAVGAENRHDPTRALACYRECADLLQQTEDRFAMVTLLNNMASHTGQNGRSADAIRLFAAAHTLANAVGIDRETLHQQGVDRKRTRLRESLGERVYQTAWAAGSALSPADAIAEALAAYPVSLPTA